MEDILNPRLNIPDQLLSHLIILIGLIVQLDLFIEERLGQGHLVEEL